MENPRKLDGKLTTANDRIQRMRNLWTTRNKDENSNYLLCRTDLSQVVNENINKFESFRQRRSARYALEWLERIRPDPRDFKLEKMGKEKMVEDEACFVKIKPSERSLSKAYARVQDCSTRNFSKYRDDFKESRKIRDNIRDSFLNYYHPSRDEAVAEIRSRNLVPAENGQIFRYKEEHIELLSVDEMVPPEKASPREGVKRTNLNLCHSSFQPFFNEKKTLRNGQNSFTVNEMSREAVVIYRRKGHRRVDDWKNYRIEEYSFGKAKLGLALDSSTKRSSSETRGKTPGRQNCVTRRRRSKFHYKPLKLGRSVSIEFKKFDEIREMFHPDKLNPIFQCGEKNNACFWESNEFRLRSSAEKKLNLFREMKKVEKDRRRKFQDTVARSLNYRCAIAESIESISSGTVMSNGGVKIIPSPSETNDAKFPETSAVVPVSSEQAVQQYNNTGVFKPFLENTTPEEDASGGPSDQMALNKVRDILDELIAGEGIRKRIERESEKEKSMEGDSNLSSVLAKIFGKETNETSELERLMLRLKDVLRKERSGTLETDNWKLMRSEEKLRNIDETIPSVPVSLIAYPASIGGDTEHKGGGIGQMKKLKNYAFDDDSDSKIAEPVHGKGTGKEERRKIDRKRLSNMYANPEDMAIFDNLESERNIENSYTKSDTFVKLWNTSAHEGDTSDNQSSSTTRTNRSAKRKGRKTPEPSRKPATKSEGSKSKTSSLHSKGEPTLAVEKRIINLECKLKELLRRIGVCPTKEQEAIKKCLERLKETSEAVLRRLRMGRLDSSKCRQYGRIEKVFHSAQRGYQSEPESTIKMNKEQKSIILKTSGSEIQLNVGMEITMENFDPVTGEKLRPEENRNFEQQGNIQCKLLKPGDKPVTFINTNFLYNPKTGMLFKGCHPTNRRRKNEELPLKPTKTYLFSKIIEPAFPPEPEENSSSRKKSKFMESSKRDSSEESGLSSEFKYTVDQETPSETSKSVHSDAFRVAVEREERKNVKYLGRHLEDTSDNTLKRPARRNNQKRAPLIPNNKSGIKFSVQAVPGQTYYQKQSPQGKTEKPGCAHQNGIILRAKDKCIQTNLTGKKKVESEVIRKKSTGVQAEVKTKGKVLVNKGLDAYFYPATPERQKMVNICVQTSPSEQFYGRRKSSEAASQTNFITEETRKYLKDLETQKRLAKLFSFTWSFGFLVCKLVYYMQSVSAICSVLTLAAMSVERYYAIVHPMRAQYVCTISQARKIITFTWISAMFLAIPVLFAQIHMPVGVRIKGFWCVRDYDNPTIWRAHETYMLLLILVIPTSVMGVAYTTICMEIWHVMERRQDLTGAKLINVRQSKTQSNSYSFRAVGKEKKKLERKTGEEHADDQAHVRQAIKMLVAVVVIFVVCWTPLLIDNLLQAYGVLPYLKFGKQKNLATIFHLMAYFNSCINPIIYGFMSKNFRESFRKALCCGKRTSRTSARNASVSHDRSTSIRYAESSFGRTVSITIPD